MYPKQYDLKYVSGSGVEVRLNAWPYLWEITDLLDYKWDYTSTPKTVGYGAKISRFTKRSQTRSMQIALFSGDGQPVAALASALTEIFETDVLNETPGKLYINGQYCTGYIVESATSTTRNTKIARLQKLFITDYPFWISEELLSYSIVSTGTGFMLPTALPMMLSRTSDWADVNNDHYTACNAIITIHGPVVDPLFTIDGHIYRVWGVLYAGQQYVINQPARTVTKVTSAGEINAFNSRDKNYSVFEPIPAGTSSLRYSGDFAIDILLMKERSEPEWA